MNIYRLIVYSKQVEGTRLKRKSKEGKKAKSYEGCSYKGRIDIRDKPRFKKRLRFYSIVPTNFPRIMMIGCVTVSLTMEEVVVHKLRSQLEESVARSIMVIT